MAEKRKLPARERREPAAKRRVSEAAPQTPSQPQSSSSRKKASTPGIASNAASTPSVLPPEPPVDVTPLPTKIKDGEGLPTVATPQQSLALSDKEYQSIAESAVLLASLERSKRKWLSDGILVRYWTKPKKTKRDQIEGKNPPKESMSKVGPCAIMVGPHLFDAMLYTVKDPNAPPPIQYTPPQRPMVHYGHPNNFQQYHPYPHPPPPLPQTMPPHQQPQPVRQPPPSAHPQPGYQPKNHNQPMRPPPQHGRASGQGSPNPPHPPPGGPQQRPSPSQPAQPQPPKPSPDPVIQMLATRAASDPELKALMRVVASTEATQEQLRAFQSHIDELNAIIRAREQRQQQRQQPAAPPPPQNPPQPPSSQQKPPEPQSNPTQARSQSQSQPQQLPRVEVQIPRRSPSGNPPQTPSQQPASQAQTPNTTPQVKQEPNTATPSQAPAPTPSGPNASITPGPPPASAPHPNSKQPSPAVRPMPHPPPPPQSAGPRPVPPYTPYQQPPYQGQPPPIHSRPPQYGSPVPYYRPAPPPPSPRLNYKSVVLEFTSPLTPYGSSTSGHAGSGDRYLFPENTILEWLPGGTTVLASFLLVRKVDPNAPFPIETASDLANSRAKGKSSKSKKKKTADEKKEDEKAKEKNNQPAPSPSNPEPSSSNAAPETKPAAPTEGDKPPSNTQDDQKDQPPATTTTTTTTDTKADPAKENPEDTKTKEPNLKEYYQPITFRIQAPNPKVLEPLARVVKTPDEVRKYMNEIMDRAERAPDGFLAYRLPREEAQLDEKRENEDHGKKSGTGTPVPALNATAGSRGRSSRGSKVVVEQEDVVDTDVETGVEDVEEEEELKDFYGAPTGIGFW